MTGAIPARLTRDHGPHPQLLHHRPHRPRQVDARRPPHPALRGGGGPGVPRPDPRLHGPRTGARDHDQGEHRHPAVHRQGREDVRAQPDRHARARRLLPRGAPLADELRGRVAGGRRLAGGGSADGREPVSRDGVRAHGGAGDQQDRPAVRRRGPGDGGDRPRPRARPVRVDPGLGQDGHGHRRPAGGDRHEASSAQGRPAGAAEGAALRRPVRLLSRRRAAGAALRRHAEGPDPRAADALGCRAQGRGGRQPDPQAGAGARAVGGGGGLRARGHEEPRRSGHRRHAHRGRPARRGAGSRLSRGEARRLLVDLPDGHRRLRGPDEGPREAEAQRRVPHLREGQPRPPWASASAAGSWGCSTSTWCRRGSSASTTCR